MKRLNVYIVEDNAIEATSLHEALENMGVSVVGSADNYATALTEIIQVQPDLTFVDIILKGEQNGIDLAWALKKISGTRVIFLTGTNDERAMQMAVKTDPIYYLNKPYTLHGLKSTLALCTYKLEHTWPVQSRYTAIGYDYYFDQQNSQLYFKEHPLKISAKEKKLLTLLLDARRGIVPSPIIEATIWPDNPDIGSSLRTLIYRLHQKLEFKLIETIPGLGYRLKLQ